MKYTVLEMVQTILSAADEDEVNSISDTATSLQAAETIRTAFNDIVSRPSFPEHKLIFELDSSSSSGHPVVANKPEWIRTVDWIKYNCQKADETATDFQLLTPLSVEEFISRMHRLDTDADNVESFTLTLGESSFEIYYQTDKAPQYYTSFDDNTIVFDSLDSAVDVTIQADKTVCYGVKATVFTMEDGFIPELDDAQFALLLQEAKSLFFLEKKQSPHPKAEQSARRHWLSSQRTKNSVKLVSDFDALPNFGRKK